MLTGRDQPRIARLREDLEEEGYDVAAAVTADITSERGVAELAATAAEAGVLGAVVHTAGLSPVQAPWETVVSVNLTGTALLLSAFGPLAGPGSVAVCLGSSAAYTIPVPPAADALLDDPCAADLIPKLEAVLRESAPEQEGYGFAVRAYGASKRGLLRLVERDSGAVGRGLAPASCRCRPAPPSPRWAAPSSPRTPWHWPRPAPPR